MQNKLKRNNFIQTFILILIFIMFLGYICYTISLSIKREQIVEYIDKNKLTDLEIIILENDLEEIYKNPTKEE